MKEINDNEIRIIGHKPPTNHKKIIIILVIAIVAVVLLWLLIKFIMASKPEETPLPLPYETPSEKAQLTNIDTTLRSYTEIFDTTINDVQLRLYSPVNALAELQIGQLDTTNPDLILAAQAADVRADNGEILGAFVLKGELVSRGNSRCGYCSIINNEIKIGHSDYASCYEEVVENSGYFFRQYSLVSDSSLVEVKTKGKAIRNALCWYKGKICVVGTQERESFHDFAQALVDLGVSEAINLVGSYNQIFAVAEDGTKTNIDKCRYKNANYIVWKSNTNKNR